MRLLSGLYAFIPAKRTIRTGPPSRLGVYKARNMKQQLRRLKLSGATPQIYIGIQRRRLFGPGGEGRPRFLAAQC